MYGCESWTVKKAEHWRIDAFKLWCWRRLLRVPWAVRRSNQPILKEISPDYSLERLMLKLKLQYFGHLMWRTDSFGKTLMLGKIEGRRRGRQRMRWLDGIIDSMDMSLSKLRSWWWTGRPGVLLSMGSQRIGHDWVTELSWAEETSRLGKDFQYTYNGIFKKNIDHEEEAILKVIMAKKFLEFIRDLNPKRSRSSISSEQNFKIYISIV